MKSTSPFACVTNMCILLTLTINISPNNPATKCYWSVYIFLEVTVHWIACVYPKEANEWLECWCLSTHTNHVAQHAFPSC